MEHIDNDGKLHDDGCFSELRKPQAVGTSETYQDRIMRLEQAIAAKDAELADLRRENDVIVADNRKVEELRAENKRLQTEIAEWKRPPVCLWCRRVLPDDKQDDKEALAAALLEHLMTCPDHPMRMLEARIAELENVAPRPEHLILVMGMLRREKQRCLGKPVDPAPWDKVPSDSHLVVMDNLVDDMMRFYKAINPQPGPAEAEQTP